MQTVDNMDEEEIGFRYRKALQTFKYFGGQGVLWFLMKKYFLTMKYFKICILINVRACFLVKNIFRK